MDDVRHGPDDRCGGQGVGVEALVRALTAAIAAIAVVGGAMLPVVDAAATTADEQLVGENPLDNTPRVLDGRVLAIKRVGDLVIVGGTFTQVQEAAPNSQILLRTGLFAFDATTGAVSASFVPQLSTKPDAEPAVNALVVSANGQSVYVGGDFRAVNGGGPARLQLLALADGSRVSSFANDPFNSKVLDLALAGGRLYVSGSFTAVGDLPRRGLATLDASTGAVTQAVTTPFTGTASKSGVTAVRKIDLTPAGDRLVAIGNFKRVDGQLRSQIAMLNTGGSTATLGRWSTTRFGADCGRAFDSYLHDVDIAPDGSFFVVVTTGGFGGGSGVRLCDSASRWETYRSGSQQPTWVDYAGGDTFWAVEVTGPVAYVGGHFRWMNNLLTPNGGSAGPGAIPREGLAALDTRNGLPFSWNPTRTRGVGVFDFHVTQTELWAGSDTAIWAGERRDRLAAFPWTGGLELPNDRTGVVPGDVVQLDSRSMRGVDATSHYLSGRTVPAQTGLDAGAIDWSRVRGAFMVDDTLFTAWGDGTLRRQTFDGRAFGPLATVDLAGNSFSGELSSSRRAVTSMFFDRRTGRLYYTREDRSSKNPDGGLFYRAFTPESGALGDVASSALRRPSRRAIDASNVRGAFLAGNQLHFVTAAGQLRRIRFSSSGFVSSSKPVNSAIDWRARGIFLSTQPSIRTPNAGPTAAFTHDCVGLSCSWDASGSSDADGSVTSFTWDFGDGSPAVTGVDTQHVFPSAGSYPVTLTVSDDDGAIDARTEMVAVAPIPSSITFREASFYRGQQLRFHKWFLPGGIQSGDTVVMAVSGFNTADPGVVVDADKVPLAGWSVIGDVADTDTRTVLYTKTAVAGDAGSRVAVQYTAGGTTVSTKAVVTMGVYSGVSAVGTVATAIENASRARYDHTTPGVSEVADGDWVLSYWSDKGAGTTGWTPPPGQVSRGDATSYVADGDPSTVRVSALLTDDGAPVRAGPRPGLTATASDRSTSGTMVTVVLQTR